MDNIHALLYPQGVAVVGSASPGKLGAVLAGRLEAGGFERIYCVNPKAQGVGGIRGYASVEAIGERVDMAVIASPAATVAAAIHDAGRAGVKAAVIISSGFSEAGHPELEREVSEAAAAYGIRYIGPNCAGLINTAFDLIASLEAAPLAGRISVISQSGAIGGIFMEKSRSLGIGVGKFLSFGNGTNLDATALLRYLADDADTDVIALYIENVKEGRQFMEALSFATAKKPVVVIKSGRTAGGQRAAQSHTGAMAGADAVYDAAFAKCGAVRVGSIEEMLLLCKAFASVKTLPGKRITIITNSGGPGVLTADRCETLGLQPCAPSEKLREKLKTFLPAHAGLSNPIDLTVEGDAAQYESALAASLEEYDAAIVIYVGTPYLQAAGIAQAVAAAKKTAEKPIAAYFEVGPDIMEAKDILRRGGVLCFESGEAAAEAYSGIMKHGCGKGELHCAATLKRIQSEYLLEPDCMALLREAQLPVPPYRLALSAEEAEAFAVELGYPVCMKVVSRDIVHKSDVGGVKLNIGAGSVRPAFDVLKSICIGKDFSGVLLYPMLKKGVETIMGLTRDPQFGPVVAFGMGGVYTEALRDIVLRPAPVSREEAMAMIQSVKAYRILAGTRGAAPCDIPALASMLAKLSELMFIYEEIRELDLNPVFAYEDRALVADVRILL